MQNPLLQQIDALAKEKGIEPDVIISAIEDAVAAASRKHYKSENLQTRFNTGHGQVELFAVKTIVEEVTDPATEISLEPKRSRSTATKPKSTWRWSSRSRPRSSAASPRRPPSR